VRLRSLFALLPPLLYLGAGSVAAGCAGNECRTDLEDIQAKFDACQVPLASPVRSPYDTEPVGETDQACKLQKKATRDCEASCFRPAPCSAIAESPQHDPLNGVHAAQAAELQACLMPCPTIKPPEEQ